MEQVGGHRVDRARGGARVRVSAGFAATVQGRPNERVIRAPGDSLSALTCSEASLHGRSRGGGMAGGEELSAPVELGLRGTKEAGKRGVRGGSSHGFKWRPQQARGGTMDDGWAPAISIGRGRRRPR